MLPCTPHARFRWLLWGLVREQNSTRKFQVSRIRGWLGKGKRWEKVLMETGCTEQSSKLVVVESKNGTKEGLRTRVRPQVKQSAILASPIYIGQSQGEEKKHKKRSQNWTSLLFESACPHAQRCIFLCLPNKTELALGREILYNIQSQETQCQAPSLPSRWFNRTEVACSSQASCHS